MRETYRSSLFRCLVCLILVCCILVNLSPVRAEALPISTWVWLEASMVFASLFAGLGVSPVDELAAGFREICDSCWDFISLNYDFVTDDEKIAVWATGTDEMPFMIDQELVETVRDWLFSSKIVVEEAPDEGWAFYNGYSLPVLPTDYDVSVYPHSLIVARSSSIELHVSNNKFVAHNELSIGSYSYSTKYIRYSLVNSKWSLPESNILARDKFIAGEVSWIWANYNIFDGHFGTLSSDLRLAASESSRTPIISSNDENLDLNYVAPSSEDFTTGYSDWAAGAISVPGIRSKEEEKEVVVPLSIPGTAADVYSFAQTDVWTGANTAADVIAQAVPITGTDTGDPSVPSVPEVPAEVAPYTFSLNDIFPFCIPFDLYDFLTCLDATPVAPVINWELHLPGGSTYPLTVDLSAFDSVAQLLRRLELLVFSIALAIKTRDLIKG